MEETNCPNWNLSLLPFGGPSDSLYVPLPDGDMMYDAEENLILN